MSATTKRRPATPDSHDFPKRPYDLVKEFVIALGVVSLLTLGLSAVFSSPDEKAITMAAWAKAVPSDVAATAAGELAGTTASATYGPPYNHQSPGQTVLGIPLQRWGGVRLPTSSADLVLQPLEDQQGGSLLDEGSGEGMARRLPGPAGPLGDRLRGRARQGTRPGPRQGDPGTLRAGPGHRPWLRGPWRPPAAWRGP